MVALFLDAYSRQDVDGRRFATVYHALVVAETGLSLASVRRALRELTSGAFPLFEKRGASGQPRTVRARTWQRENWRAVAYYWIENLDAYLAARDTARAGNLLAYEERKQALHADRVRLQTEMLTGKVDASTYETAILQLDAQARGRLPKEAAARKPTVRCLTAKQLERFADQLAAGGASAYSTLQRAGGDKGVREFHALHRHVFGDGGAGAGCATCEAALFDAVRQHRAVMGALASGRGEAARCGCGVPVVRSNSESAIQFWVWMAGTVQAHTDCIHERNRLMKLRGW
jgi:hypothetical protein